jgi:hypothetical protein
MDGNKIGHIRKIILDAIPDGVLKRLVETDLILIPSVFKDKTFETVGIDVELPNLSMKITRFVDMNHWWIGDEIYTYFSPAEMDSILIGEIAKSIEWIQLQ